AAESTRRCDGFTLARDRRRPLVLRQTLGPIHARLCTGRRSPETHAGLLRLLTGREHPMKRIALLTAFGLGACAAPPPPAYHAMAEHPFEIKEFGANVRLDVATPASMAEQARRFADARPNNGSSFTVRA